MEFEEFDDDCLLEREFAIILRAMLCRNGGKISIGADEMPRCYYSIDVDHREDGSISVHLYEHGMMQ